MTPVPFAHEKTLRAVAYFVGERLDLRSLDREKPLSEGPLTLRAGRAGLAVAFRYGAVVLFHLQPVEEAAFLASLAPFVSHPFEQAESDEAEIHINAEERERAAPDGTIRLREASLPRLQILAHVLAKSAVLAHYEETVSEVLERIEPLALQLKRGGRRGVGAKRILSEMAEVLVTQTRTVGRVEVAEQPEMTWDEPELERLYARLSDEYDLRERDRVLERKLALVARVAETLHELLQNRRILRVEWYIVILILVEIVLIAYEMFWHA